jgi:hypothetical protein
MGFKGPFEGYPILLVFNFIGQIIPGGRYGIVG